MIHRCCTLLLFALLASLSGGCSWSMKMPPESKACVMLTPEQAATAPFDAIWRKVELEIPRTEPADDLLYEDYGFLREQSLFACGVTRRVTRPDGVVQAHGYALGLWDLVTGTNVAFLDHPWNKPTHLAVPPKLLAHAAEHDMLLTYFDGSIYLWRVSTQQAQQRIDVVALLDQHRVSAAAYEPLRVSRGEIDPSNSTFTARLPVLGVRSWGIESGEPAPTQPLPSWHVPSDSLATYEDLSVTSSFKLKKGDKSPKALGSMRGPIATGHRAQFSPDGRYLVGLFWTTPRMLDFNHDATPTHLRAWSTETGELTTWIRFPEARATHHGPALMFVSNHEIVLGEWSGSAARPSSIIDIEKGREVARWSSTAEFHIMLQNPTVRYRFGKTPEVWIAERTREHKPLGANPHE